MSKSAESIVLDFLDTVHQPVKFHLDPMLTSLPGVQPEYSYTPLPNSPAADLLRRKMRSEGCINGSFCKAIWDAVAHIQGDKNSPLIVGRTQNTLIISPKI